MDFLVFLKLKKDGYLFDYYFIRSVNAECFGGFSFCEPLDVLWNYD